MTVFKTKRKKTTEIPGAFNRLIASTPSQWGGVGRGVGSTKYLVSLQNQTETVNNSSEATCVMLERTEKKIT